MDIDILCMGNASYDIYFPMDAFPEEDMKYSLEIFLEACGGPAANAAYLLGMWKAPCGFAGCVGNDPYGREIIRSFQSAGVDTSFIEMREGYHTPLSCIITNTTNGSRTILNRRHIGNNMAFPEDALMQNAAAGKGGPKYLHFDSHEYAASLRALEMFPAAVSVLDAGSRRPATEELSGKVDHLLCSESFAAAMTGINKMETMAEQVRCAGGLMEINPRPGCFTLGDNGLVFWEHEGVFHLPAFPVRAVDSTAAGDIFHGAFLYSCWRGNNFSDSLLFSSATAALSVQKHGGRPSIPPVYEVENFIARHAAAGTLPAPRRIR